jgi:hypothetical protein
MTIHVGMGEVERVDQAEVRWPSNGPTRTLTDLPAGRWKIYPPSRLCDLDGDGVDHDDFDAFSACFFAGFSPGCEMMDENGDSSIWVDDLDECFIGAPADCNGNGTQDLAEIMLSLALDADDDGVLNCCESGAPKEPNPVGATLLVDRNGSNEAVLSWTAPAVDPNHDAATAYDVFRSTTSAAPPFAVIGQPAATSFTDNDETPALSVYLVSSRNACGTSGEEPF